MSSPSALTNARPWRRGRANQARHDLREGGSWSQPQRVKNALIRWMVSALLWVADRLPEAWLLSTLGWLGSVSYWLSPKLRRRTQRNLAAAELDPKLAVSTFRNAGQNLGRCLLLRRPGEVTSKVLIDASSERALRRALALGRGVVFVSLHLGPFELIAARIAELCAPGPAPRASIVVRESYDPALDPLVDAHRTGRGLEVIHRGKPGSAHKILRALKRGRAVGFLPDLGGRVRSTRVTLFGQQLSLPIGPQRIAQRTGAPLLLGFLVPSAPEQGSKLAEQRFSLIISELARPELTSKHASASLDSALAQGLERAIRQCPEHWLWMARELVSDDAAADGGAEADGGAAADGGANCLV